MTTIKIRDENSEKGGAVHLTIILGYQTPSLFLSDGTNDKTQAQGAQAGGFWRSRR
jgi:hypothetical protein